MAKEKDISRKDAPEQAAPQQTPQPLPGQSRVKLSFAGVTPQYANFCTFAVRGGEVFISFGKAFVPTEELKVDTQIVMSLRNLEQMHQAIARVLQQAQEQEGQQPQEQ